MNLFETALFGIASGLTTFVLTTTWAGYERGAYEMNPGARFIFETLYRFSGSWFLSIAALTPLVILGLYLAVKLIGQGARVFLICFILLILPAVLHDAIIIKLPSNEVNLLFSFGLAGPYLLFEWLRRKRSLL